MKLNKIINRWVALGISLLGIVPFLSSVYLAQEMLMRYPNRTSRQVQIALNEAIEQECFFRAGTKINIQNDDKNKITIKRQGKIHNSRSH
jgi:hypothetical protein